MFNLVALIRHPNDQNSGKNDIIADFRQGLNNSEIAEKHNRIRTTIVEFRKQYDQALSAQNPEAALAELIRTETHLSFDAIKAVMNQYEEVISAIELPWSEGIEKSTQKNLDILGSLFHKTNVSFS